MREFSAKSRFRFPILQFRGDPALQIFSLLDAIFARTRHRSHKFHPARLQSPLFSRFSMFARAASCILFPNHTPRSTAAEWRSPTASELKYYEFTKWGWATKGPSLMRKIDVTSSYLGRLTRSDDRRGIVSRCRLHCGRIARSYESTSDEYLRALAPSRAPRDFREGNTNGPGGKRVRSNDLTRRPLEFLLLLFT